MNNRSAMSLTPPSPPGERRTRERLVWGLMVGCCSQLLLSAASCRVRLIIQTAANTDGY
jgi:hypothetical protein